MLFFSPCTLMMFGGLVHNKKKKKIDSDSNDKVFEQPPIKLRLRVPPAQVRSLYCCFLQGIVMEK
jgi:hypothetical protein